MPTSLKRRAEESSSSSSSGDKIVDVQPLRDLAKNFDIDIEPYLDEYLKLTAGGSDEEDDAEEGGEGGGGGAPVGVPKTQNFAAAALKIQNSAGIYNRKVDFYHEEAIKVYHDFVRDTSKANHRKRPSGASAKGGDPSIDAFRDYDADLEFLLLDDVLPTDRTEGQRKINLKEDEERPRKGESGSANATLDQTVATSAGIQGRNSHGDNHNGGTPEVTLLSLDGVISATRATDPDGTFLVSRQSLDRAGPAAMSRMLMAHLQGGHGPSGGGGDRGGCLRLLAGTCDVDGNGALLLPGTRASVFVNGDQAAARARAAESLIFPDGPPGPPPRHEDENDDARDFGPQADNEASFGNEGNDWGGDDNDGDGFRLHDPAEKSLAEDVGDETRDENVESTVAVDAAAPKSSDTEPPAAMEDPWATLDPHEPSNERAQPLRIDITYVLPPEFDEEDRPSASVTGSSTRTKKKKGSHKKKRDTLDAAAAAAVKDLLHPPFLADVTFDAALRDCGSDNEEDLDQRPLDGSHASLQQREISKGSHLRLLQQLKQKKLIFGEEFAYVFKAHSKPRDVFQNLQRKLQQQEEVSTKAKETNAVDCNDDDDYGDDEYGGGFDVGGGDDDNSFGCPDNIENPNDETKQTLHRSNVDFNTINDVFGGGDSIGPFDENDHNGEDFAHTTQHPTFEELCRAHLRKFAKSAETHIGFETQLTKRVAAWQSGLAPLLDEQERRPAFDIHECGRQILRTMELNLPGVHKRRATGEKKLEAASSAAAEGAARTRNAVRFSKLVPADECEDYEVCRLFLSTLMLCNSGNVAIYEDEKAVVESLDSLNIELLDATFQPPMEPCFAPASPSLQQDESVMASSNVGIVEEDDDTV